MKSNVLFSCGYHPPEGTNGNVSSSRKVFFICLALGIFLMLCLLMKSVAIPLFLLFFGGITSWGFISAAHAQSVQVTPTALQIVQGTGKILKQIALADIKGIYKSDKSTVILMVYTGSDLAYAEETLWFVENVDGLIAAVKKYGSVENSESQMMTPESPQQIPLQPHVLAEEKADKLHAAQHLLNQGMISQQQFDGLLMPPQAAQQPDLSEQNADDYFRRQELLAQQIGSAPACRKEEQQETVLREES